MFQEIDNMVELKKNEKVIKKTEFVKKIMMIQMEIGYVNTKKLFKIVGINKDMSNAYIKKVAMEDPEFYSKYLTAMENHFEKFKQDTKNNMLIMAELVNTGIKLYDGSIREFDLLDCYEIVCNNFESFERHTIIPIFEETQKEHGFEQKYKFGKLRAYLSQCYDFAKESFTITRKHIENDQCYKLADEEKQIIISYFINNNIPFTEKTLFYAAKRCKMAREGNKQNNYFKTRILLNEEI